MESVLHALALYALMHDAKLALVARYPEYKRQINQVAMPSLGYKKRVWLDWRLKHFVRGRCNPFGHPQVLVKRYRQSKETLALIEHEFKHFISFAAGLPDGAHILIDAEH